jgi:hypothetical protein
VASFSSASGLCNVKDGIPNQQLLTKRAGDRSRIAEKKCDNEDSRACDVPADLGARRWRCATRTCETGWETSLFPKSINPDRLDSSRQSYRRISSHGAAGAGRATIPLLSSGSRFRGSTDDIATPRGDPPALRDSRLPPLIRVAPVVQNLSDCAGYIGRSRIGH